MRENESNIFELGERCVETIPGILESNKKLKFYDQVELVKSFCFLRDKLNASGGGKVALTRTVGWIKFRACGWGVASWKKTFAENERIYRSCVRSTTLYGNEM